MWLMKGRGVGGSGFGEFKDLQCVLIMVRFDSQWDPLREKGVRVGWFKFGSTILILIFNVFL